MIKYDRADLKKQYFQSDYFSVTKFLNEKQVISKSLASNGWIAKHTKWRQKDKKAFIKRAKELALKETEKKLVKLYQPSAEDLHQMKKTIMNLVKWKMTQMTSDYWKNIDLESKDLKGMREIIKTEMYEPTKITENYNKNEDLNQEWKDPLRDRMAEII